MTSLLGLLIRRKPKGKGRSRYGVYGGHLVDRTVAFELLGDEPFLAVIMVGRNLKQGTKHTDSRTNATDGENLAGRSRAKYFDHDAKIIIPVQVQTVFFSVKHHNKNHHNDNNKNDYDDDEDDDDGLTIRSDGMSMVSLVVILLRRIS